MDLAKAEDTCAWHTPESEICILAVDDQPANLIALEAALKGCSYRLMTATSGEEAVAKAFAYEYAAILLDIQMPELDGFETAQLIRSFERGRHTPIIFLTALSNDDKYIEKGYEVGAVDYIYKPINVSILKAKLEVFAELFRKSKELEFHSSQSRRRERDENEKQIAEIKRDTQEQYRDLVEGIRNGIVWTAEAESLRFKFVSPQAEAILGYSISRWLDDSQFIWNRIPAEDRERLIAAIEKAKETNTNVEVEHRKMRADGTTLWFNTNLRCTFRQGATEIRGLCVDVTRLKETEKSLRDMVKMRDEFLSIASHELKTPLTPLQLQMESFIRLFSQGRLDKVPIDILTNMLETSSAQVSILSRLVDQLLDVSRITAGKLQLDRSQTDLVACVREVLSMFHEDLATKGIEVVTHLPDHIFGLWDQSRLVQIVMNLVNNAIKYGNGTPIEIEASWPSRDFVSLRVSDSGIGIPQVDQARIFDRYERAVSPSNFSGLGLGLYITKQLVELHGGTIDVESKTDRGTTFTVTLPIHHL